METFIANQMEVHVAYQEADSSEKELKAFSNVKLLDLKKHKLEEFFANRRSQQWVVVYDGVEVEEQFSKKLYLTNPDTIQILSILELPSISLSREFAASELESQLGRLFSSNNQQNYIRDIENSWAYQKVSDSILDLRRTELGSIQRSDIVLLNSDFDHFCLQDLFPTKNLPMMISVPLFMDSSGFKSLLSEGSLLTSQTPYQFPVRRCSIQLITDSSPSDIINISIFLSSVWPLVMEQTDTIRLDIMDISSKSGSGQAKAGLKPSASPSIKKHPEISLLELCSRAPNVRVVSVSLSNLLG